MTRSLTFGYTCEFLIVRNNVIDDKKLFRDCSFSLFFLFSSFFFFVNV